MFEKSLQDVVKGIRANKRDPSPYISQVIGECKKELKDSDPFVKALAIRKLTYLQMMGYDMSWASFQVVEVMSQTRFAHKRIGYQAACQSFHQSTDVVLLTTNQLKKEFGSAQQYEVGQAINCLSNIVNRDLARDLLPDLVSLLGHSKPYVRKKSVLCMYKLFVMYPQGLRLTFDRLREKLGDAEAAVTSCAVNVICELSNKNPNNYLSMAPQFFRLLTTSSNNWMLIKVVKLLGSLVPAEPRLARKLLEPLATIIQNTAAKSLQYECIHTVTLALPYTKRSDGSDSKNVPAVVKLCAEHLRQFVEDDDQNLKYLGLVGFVQLMRSHPRTVVEHKELVLSCLSDDDVTIRMRALELLTGMVTKRNMEELVHKLLRFVLLSEGTYRDELISKIIFMCSRNKYEFLTDFAWYLSVLVDLATVQGSFHGKNVADQLIDVTVRVEPVRVFAVESMIGLLTNVKLMLGQGQSTIAEVLFASAWIIGEYAHLIKALSKREVAEGETRVVPRHEPFRKVVDLLTHPRATNLPPHVQIVYMQNALKVFTAALRVSEDGEVAAMLDLLRLRMHVFMQSIHVEVQERASAFKHLLTVLGMITDWSDGEPQVPMSEDNDEDNEDEVAPPPPQEQSNVSLLEGIDLSGDDVQVSPPPVPSYTTTSGSSSSSSNSGVAAARQALPLLSALFVEPMHPVNPKAQKRVPVPDGLDMGEPLDEAALDDIFSPLDDSSRPIKNINQVSFTTFQFYNEDVGGMGSMDVGNMNMQGFGSDPKDDYTGMDDKLGDSTSGGMDLDSKSSERPQIFSNYDQTDPFYIRAVNPDEVDVDDIPMLKLRAEDLEGPRGKRGKKKKRTKQTVEYNVDMDELMPVGHDDSDQARRYVGQSTGNDLDAVDLTTPLRADEVMPERKHHVVEHKFTKDKDTGELVDAPGGKKKGSKERTKKETKKETKKGRKKDAITSKKKKSRSAPASAGGADLLDLLDFGEPAPAPVSEAATPPKPRVEEQAASSGLDILDGGHGSNPGEQKKKSKKGEKSKSSKGSAKGAQKGTVKGAPKGGSAKGSSKGGAKAGGKFDYWAPVIKDHGLRVELKTSAKGASNENAQLKLTVRCKNVSSDTLGQVEFSILKVAAPFRVSKASTVQVTSSLSPKTSGEATLSLSAPGSPVEQDISVGAVFRLSKSAGLLPEDLQIPVQLRIPATALLMPNSISEDGFMNFVSQRSLHSASARIPVRGSGDPVGVIAGFLHARVVEREKTSAASLYAAFPSGDQVAILVKLKDSGRQAVVDLKCSKAHHATQIAEELKQLSL